MKKGVLLLLLSLLGLYGQLQPDNFLSQNKAELHVYYNAFVHLEDNQVLQNGMIVFQGDEILYVGNHQAKYLQKGAAKDLNGKHIYPAFVAINKLNLPKYNFKKGKYPYYNNPKANEVFNDAINWHQDVNQADFKEVTTGLKKAHQQGAGINLFYPHDGIVSGYARLYNHQEGTAQEKWSTQQYLSLSFEKGSSVEQYPTSLVGAIALLRQTYYDIQYLSKTNDSALIWMKNWSEAQKNPALFIAKEHLDLERAQKVAKEFDVYYNLILTQDMYKIGQNPKNYDRLNLFLGSSPALPYQFKNAAEENDASLGQLMDWYLGQEYIYNCYKKNIEIALVPNASENIIKDLQYWFHKGVSKSYLLKALTQTPLKYLNLSEQYGTLTAQKKACFFVASKDLFEKGASLLWTVDHGVVSEYDKVLEVMEVGTYDFLMNQDKWTMQLKAKGLDYEGTLVQNQDTIVLLFEKYDGGVRYKQIKGKRSKSEFFYGIGKSQGKGAVMEGTAQSFSGEIKHWFLLKRKDNASSAITKEKPKDSLTPITALYPPKRFGLNKHWIYRNYTVLIKNVMVWTNTDKGNLGYHDVLIQNGKIAKIGKGLGTPGAADTLLVIDGTGKHLTTGIIDEHSHIALSRGVNEAGYNSSAQVRMADAINPYDVNIYRQLAGGVTSSQLLHGSANPIGGQSAIIKLKWGRTADEMINPNATPFIKFALGENVKQSNWGDHQVIRFPQSRMGVEQFYYDEFMKAKVYSQGLKKDSSFRRILRYDALTEILEQKRFITCHSYRQNEINMLMKVGDSLGFVVNTFTHILEGYKVADKMKIHGAGASTFSDWWAYKYEVNDAIPYNAQIMHDQGIVVAINSDDAEMGRRLNQEAAKVVLYGGVSEKEAWKMVTLNPAILLHLDDRLGKIKVGYDADLVLWDDHPLSIAAKVHYTFIEGVPYYDRARDLKMSVRDHKLKDLLLMMMRKQIENGTTGIPFKKKIFYHYHCDSMEN